MKVYQQDKCVIFENRLIAMPAMLAAGAVLLALHTLGITSGSGADYKLELWAGAVLLALGAAATLRVEITQFDLFRKQIRHQAWSLFQHECTHLRFADVEAVCVESLGGQGKCHRVVMQTKRGPLPLSSSYDAGAEDWEAMADKVRAAVGLTTAASRARQSIVDLMAQYSPSPAKRSRGAVSGLRLS